MVDGSGTTVTGEIRRKLKLGRPVRFGGTMKSPPMWQMLSFPDALPAISPFCQALKAAEGVLRLWICTKRKPLLRAAFVN